MKRLTTKEFIEKSRAKHGDKYDYSEVNYSNNSTAVKIICPKDGHGIFWQGPNKHMVGQRCPKCAAEVPSKPRNTTEDFISRAEKIHNYKYDYSESIYVKARENIIINCQKNNHGYFEQKAYSHLSGVGCPKCALDEKYEKNTQKFNLETFIEKSKAIHGDKYDYSEVVYKNVETRVKVKCKEHNEFFMIRPKSHMKNVGNSICESCHKSRPLNSGAWKKRTQDEFINLSKELHLNKYDYTKVNYQNDKTKIIVICPIDNHNEFLVSPNNHLKLKGCPKCKDSKGEIEIRRYLENNKIEYLRQKTFENCKNKRLLKFDFYLPKHNICIEFDGAQHYKAVKVWGGEKHLNGIRINDSIKNKYCEENNIDLIRISYKEINKVSEILNLKLY